MAAPLLYKKMTGFATTHGQEFEWTLAALLYLRGLNSGLRFQLGSNVDGAGALDDAVFRFKRPEDATYTNLYVQLKHKSNKTIQRDLLTKPKGDFNLKKYFESYIKIKESMSKAVEGSLFDGAFEESRFVIFTNAKTSEPLGQERRDHLCPAEGFVWCGEGSALSFDEDEDILKCLHDSGAEGKEFLGRLRLFCGQPDADGLKAAIETELRKVDDEIIQGVEFQTLLDCFLRRMKRWCEASDEVLDNDHVMLRASVLEVVSQGTEKKYVVPLAFEEAALAGLRDSMARGGGLVYLKSPESSCRSSATKLSQAFGGQLLVLDCKGLLANRVALLAQWGKGDATRLVVSTNDWNSSRQEDYFKIVKDLLASRHAPPIQDVPPIQDAPPNQDIPPNQDTPPIQDVPPIVLLANSEKCPFEALSAKFSGSARSCEDDFLFTQLTAESRRKVLAKGVSLQGHLTTLQALLKDSPGGADRVLDACSVVEILEREGGLTLGSAFGEDIDFYVDRHLEATVVKDTVFQDGALRESVTVRVMQSRSSADLGLDDRYVGESSGFPRVSATNNRAGLFDKAVSFLSSLNDSKSLNSVDMAQIVSRLSMSELVADKDNGEVFIGPEVAVGSFRCWPIGLRLGQQDAVTALWVRSSHSTQSGFLFVSDKTSENDARKLSDFHKSKHWLSLKDGQLCLVRSRGDIEAIRRHVDEDQVSTFAPENAMDVEDRLVLVCAEPGMGKSTLMARLAKEAKEAHPRHFVFLVALNDHYQLFAQGKHKDVLGFLCSANKIESPLHRSLLKYALEVSGDVVVLLDGYDEIAPKYVKESCDLLASLVDNTMASKVWMTSRNSIQATLEARISKFAVALRRFTEEDQKSYLKKFWAAKATLSETELDDFIKGLVEKISEAVGDKEKNFLGIPLQTRMLAEVYEGYVTGSAGMSKLPDKLDSLELLNRFVDKKLRVYVEAKLMTSPDSPNYEDILESFRESYMEKHSKAGIILILGDDITEIKGMESIQKNPQKFLAEMIRGVDKTGFIDSVVNGKPRFVHRVFAEYFVAKWISENFAAHRELVESKMFTADFGVVRNLFDRMLAKDHDLHTAVINEDLEEVRTLLAREDVDVDAKDGGGRTALHLAASLGTDRNREQNKRLGDILDLLVGKTSDFDQVDDVLGVSPLKYADVTQSLVAVDRLKPSPGNKNQLTLTLQSMIQESTLETIFYLDLHNLLGFCLANGLDIQRFRFTQNRTPLGLAAEFKSPDAVRVLLEALDEAGQAKAVHSVDKNGHSVLMLAALAGCVKCVGLIVEAGGKLTQVHNDGCTPLMMAAEKGHQAVVSCLLDNFDVEREGMSVPDYINMTQKIGRTAIHLAARNGHAGVIKTLIGQGGDPRALDRYKNTPLHLAVDLDRRDAVRVLMEELDEAHLADAVRRVDDNDDSLVFNAAVAQFLKPYEMAFCAGGDFTQMRNDGSMPMILSTIKVIHDLLGSLLNFINREIEGMSEQDNNVTQEYGRAAADINADDVLSHFISTTFGQGGDSASCDRHNSTPLDTAEENQSPGLLQVFKRVFDTGDSEFPSDSLGNLLSGLESSFKPFELVAIADGDITHDAGDGGTLLMAAALNGHADVVSRLLDDFDAEREGMSLQDYINMTQVDGRTAIHLAVVNGHQHIISTLIGHGGDPQIRDHENVTPLQLAVGLKRPDAVRVLMGALDEAGRADALRLTGNGLMLLFTSGTAADCLTCFQLAIRANFDLAQLHKEGRTPFILATIKDFQYLMNFLPNSISLGRAGTSQPGDITMTQEGGSTANQVPAENGFSQLIGLFLGQCGYPANHDRQNNTPSDTAAQFRTPAELRVLMQAMEAARGGGSRMLFPALFETLNNMFEPAAVIDWEYPQVDGDGSTPLMAAAQQGHLEVVSRLLDTFDAEREGMSLQDYINVVQRRGLAAVHFAARKGHADVIRTLIDHGGDPRSRDRDNSTPLSLAAQFRHPGAVRVILEALDEAGRADAVHSVDNDGDSVLMCAAFGGCVACVGLIVEAGGKLTQVDSDGCTPLMAAALENHASVVEYLLDNFDAEGEGMSLLAYVRWKDNNGHTAFDYASPMCREMLQAFLSSLVD